MHNLPHVLSLSFDANEKEEANRDVGSLSDCRFPRPKVIGSLNHSMKGEFRWDEEQSK
jgi:hypothetical protein